MNIQPIIDSGVQHGVQFRGGFAVVAEDHVPDLELASKRAGRECRGAATTTATQSIPAQYLLLFGNVGSSMWPAFRASPEYHDRQPHPLNRWSARIGTQIAQQFGARALFPFDGPPHLPFLQWAKKAEQLRNSKLGMLMHPSYGLWHAYRFALAFASLEGLQECSATPSGKLHPSHSATEVELFTHFDPMRAQDICRQCATQPCQNACPVHAFSNRHGEAEYDVVACFHYLQSNPEATCMTHGCQARHACPQGTEYRYTPSHAAFHMRAFVTAMAEQERNLDTRRTATTTHRESGNRPASAWLSERNPSPGK